MDLRLEPRLREIVERLGSGPRLHTITVAEARAASVTRRSLLQRPSEAVRRVEDLAVPTGAGPLRARLYAPRDGAPVLLYLHGGAWVLGDLDGPDHLCRALANASTCAVLSLDYPLAPEHPFPAAAEAAYETACWLAAGGSVAGRGVGIAVGGDSAGANLAAAVALMSRDRGGPPLRSQLLLFPPTDANAPRSAADEQQPLLTAAEISWGWRHYLARPEDGDHPYASPLRADTRGVASAIIVTAEHDVLRAEGDAYAARLRTAAVAVRHRSYPGMVHGFLGLFGELPAARRALDDVAEALRDALAD